MQFNIDALKAEIEIYLKDKDTFHLGQLAESLVYYGTGDEGVELFQSTLATAYQMYGIGEAWQAALLVFFAKQMSDNSLGWAIENGCTDDFENGEWG